MADEATSLKAAAEEIRLALEAIADGAGRTWVQVFESAPEMLRAIVVSDRFKGVGITERQNLVWDYLRTKVSKPALARLYGVHPYARDEYIELSPTTSTSTPSVSVMRFGELFSGNKDDSE